MRKITLKECKITSLLSNITVFGHDFAIFKSLTNVMFDSKIKLLFNGNIALILFFYQPIVEARNIILLPINCLVHDIIATYIVKKDDQVPQKMLSKAFILLSFATLVGQLSGVPLPQNAGKRWKEIL